MTDSLAAIIGSRMMFLGVETQNWSTDQFHTAGANLAAMGTDSVLLKVGDWSNYWYGGIPGFHARRDILKSHGINVVVPYTYSYGPKGGAFQAEIGILVAYLRDAGFVCVDIEVEWNGQASAASQLAAAIAPIPGHFFVSTWADPQWQNFDQVVTNLASATDAFMPQIYSTNLFNLFQGSVLKKYRCIPTVSIAPIPGEANDPVGYTKALCDNNHAITSIWHYGAALSNQSLTKQIFAQVPGSGGPVTPVITYDGHVKEALDAQWKSSAITPTPSMGTGIFQTWVRLRLAHNINVGPPSNNEYQTVDWNGNPIVAQDFGPYRIEWNNGNARVFGPPSGEIAV